MLKAASAKFPGSLNFLFWLRLVISFISADERLKSKSPMFSVNLSFLEVFGITVVPRYTPHLRMIWAGVLWYLDANSLITSRSKQASD